MPNNDDDDMCTDNAICIFTARGSDGSSFQLIVTKSFVADNTITHEPLH